MKYNSYLFKPNVMPLFRFAKVFSQLNNNIFNSSQCALMPNNKIGASFYKFINDFMISEVISWFQKWYLVTDCISDVIWVIFVIIWVTYMLPLFVNMNVYDKSVAIESILSASKYHVYWFFLLQSLPLLLNILAK